MGRVVDEPLRAAGGRLKAALFAGMVVVGAMNRKMLAGSVGVDQEETARRLWRNVLLESAVAVLVLMATERLAMKRAADGSPDHQPPAARG